MSFKCVIVSPKYSNFFKIHKYNLNINIKDFGMRIQHFKLYLFRKLWNKYFLAEKNE